MWHNFPYIKDKPKLLAEIRKINGQPRYTEFLIDSGADYTLLSYTSALLIGIEYKKLDSPEIQIEQASSDTMPVKRTEIIISIQDKDFLIPALISSHVIDNLLGRKGIFKHYEILFQENQKQVIFNEI